MTRNIKTGGAAIAFAFLMLAGAGMPGSDLQANSCKTACLKYRTCTVDFWKKRGRRLKTTEKKKTYLGCMNACRKHRPKIIACYKKSKNSCTKYWFCMVKAHKR